MIEPLFDLGMNDEQLKALGIISLNWGIVEREITDILCSFYGLSDPSDAVELITILDLDKKLNLLTKKIVREPRPAGYTNADWKKVSEMLAILKQCIEAYREGRNHIIHGTVVRFFGNIKEPVIWSYKKRKANDLSEIPRILNQSIHLTHVMAHLSSALYGSMLQIPLPDRPD